MSKLGVPDPMTADDCNSLGLFYASQQKHREAIQAFGKALDLDSGCAEAFYNQALSLTALGRLDEAIDYYTNAIRVRPDFQEAYFNLGNLLKKKGFLEKAIETYWLSVKLKPDFPEAYNNLGLCLKALKRFEQAVESCEKAIELKPDYAEAYNNLGLTLQDQGLWEQAIEKFESAITLKPDYSGAHYNLGFALNEIDKLDAAVSHYRRSIQLKPDFADAHNNLGAILKKQGRTGEAIAHYRTALEYSPGKAEIYNNLGNALKKSGRIDEALEMLQRALAARPDYAEAYNNMGVALQVRGNYTAALINYEKAFELKPKFAEARFNRATIDLLLGNFSRGWQGYEWRFKKRHWQDVYPIRHNLPRWDGSPFPEKRLLVCGEQGFGDIIQFVRYLPQVKALGGTVILETRKPLLACLQGAEGIDEVIDRSAVGDPAEGCDLVVPLLSLPGIFGTNLESIPAKTPYLHAEAAKVSYWKKRIRGSEFKVGLVWAGNPDQENDHMRSIALNDLMTLADIPGLRLFGLQKGTAAGQVTEIPADTGLIDLGPELEDFSDTAAAMANMDLIISVCTAATHLAGALGLPVWTLLSYAPDWRWMLNCEDSPWYPTMRLFRQPKCDDWQGVIRQVTSELKKMVQKRGAGRESNPDADFETATRHYMAGRHSQALALFHRILQVDPKHCPTLHMLGVAAHQKGDYENAKTLIGRVLSIDSQTPLYYYNFGLVCAARGEPQAAINAYRRAINLKPDYYRALNNLGALHNLLGELKEAENVLKRAISIDDTLPHAYSNLGNLYKSEARISEAEEFYEKALQCDPTFPPATSNSVFSLCYDHKLSAEEIFQGHLKYEKRMREFIGDAVSHSKRDLQKRPLKIGYVSSDFRTHSVAYFFEPILDCHDRTRFEIYCYSNVDNPDEITLRFQRYDVNWRNIFGVGYEDVVKQIMNDEIDILVDLSGHTRNSCLKVFMKKPAPVQINYLGYPFSTGLSTMDYKLTDETTDLPGEDKYYTEKLYRLDGCFLAYYPPKNTPEPSPPPCLQNGFVTFGSFNNYSKLNDNVIKLWAQLLAAVPKSRIVIKAKPVKDENVRKRLLEKFNAQRVDSDRVELLYHSASTKEHLECYNKIDIALDPFPYNGTTTICESLWMGVPVVSLIGEHHLSRVAYSILKNAGLGSLAASDKDKYLGLAGFLASNTDQLQSLREKLRMALINSPICKYDEFVRKIESAYLFIWQTLII